MAFILSAQSKTIDFDDIRERWRAYQDYLQANREAFPKNAFTLATSDWYYNPEDHGAPHDAWLESISIQESASGERNEIRQTSLRIKLLGAYQDCYLEFFYPVVYGYSLATTNVRDGHADWQADEFRLSDSGNLIHEIEWAAFKGVEARWIIEASDVQFTMTALAPS